MLLGPKLYVIAVATAAFMVVSGVAVHYYNEYLDAVTEMAVVKAELDGVKLVAKECSDNTDNLKKAVDEKQEMVRQAQAQAAITAKGNRALADKILSIQVTNPNKCEAATQLFQQYSGKGTK